MRWKMRRRLFFFFLIVSLKRTMLGGEP